MEHVSQEELVTFFSKRCFYRKAICHSLLVGHCVEWGVFRSVKSRMGTKWTTSTREKYKNKRSYALAIQSNSNMIDKENASKKVASDIIQDVRTFFENTIDRVNSEIPSECPKQRHS